ncbi:MAG: hypothetical protein JNL61_08135 [Rhizobiaceae bacterium]|nr:hypothetical protein [Rhizobiaceae bacterium]
MAAWSGSRAKVMGRPAFLAIVIQLALLPLVGGHGNSALDCWLGGVAHAASGSGKGGDSDGGGSDSGSGGSGKSGGGDSSGKGGGGDDSGGDDDSGDDGNEKAGKDGEDSGSRGGKDRGKAVSRYFKALTTYGKVEQKVVNGSRVEVRYRDGWREVIKGKRYNLFDAENRRVIDRPAKPSDYERLLSVKP